jgi:hypothetical protein
VRVHSPEGKTAVQRDLGVLRADELFELFVL